MDGNTYICSVTLHEQVDASLPTNISGLKVGDSIFALPFHANIGRLPNPVRCVNAPATTCLRSVTTGHGQPFFLSYNA